MHPVYRVEKHITEFLNMERLGIARDLRTNEWRRLSSLRFRPILIEPRRLESLRHPFHKTLA
jgi:hypothetical protein